MARITIEDCSITVKNRFYLVLLAAERAKEIALGASPMIKKTGDKATILALREIACKAVDLNELERILIQKYRRFQSYGATKTYAMHNSTSSGNEGAPHQEIDEIAVKLQTTENTMDALKYDTHSPIMGGVMDDVVQSPSAYEKEEDEDHDTDVNDDDDLYDEEDDEFEEEDDDEEDDDDGSDDDDEDNEDDEEEEEEEEDDIRFN